MNAEGRRSASSPCQPRLSAFSCGPSLCASLRSSLLRTVPAACAVVLALCGTTFGQASPSYSELPRFTQVSERLYRGAQPREGGLRRLAELGINTVVNLRGPGQRVRADAAEAAALGLRYFNVPLPVWGRPTDGRASRVLEIINAPESGRVFVHCKDGVDRTGTIVALYRITAEGWTAEAAEGEAERRGMRRVQVWMRDYIADFREPQTREAAVAAAGAPHDDGRDVRDKLGAYARTGEEVTLKARSTAVRVWRRAPGSVGGLFGRIF